MWNGWVIRSMIPMVMLTIAEAVCGYWPWKSKTFFTFAGEVLKLDGSELTTAGKWCRSEPNFGGKINGMYVLAPTKADIGTTVTGYKKLAEETATEVVIKVYPMEYKKKLEAMIGSDVGMTFEERLMNLEIRQAFDSIEKDLNQKKDDMIKRDSPSKDAAEVAVNSTKQKIAVVPSVVDLDFAEAPMVNEFPEDPDMVNSTIFGSHSSVITGGSAGARSIAVESIEDIQSQMAIIGTSNSTVSTIATEPNTTFGPAVINTIASGSQSSDITEDPVEHHSPTFGASDDAPAQIITTGTLTTDTKIVPDAKTILSNFPSSAITESSIGARSVTMRAARAPTNSTAGNSPARRRSTTSTIKPAATKKMGPPENTWEVVLAMCLVGFGFLASLAFVFCCANRCAAYRTMKRIERERESQNTTTEKV